MKNYHGREMQAMWNAIQIETYAALLDEATFEDQVCDEIADRVADRVTGSLWSEGYRKETPNTAQ
ncbi:hypothetical protein M3697_14210 [Janibacter melonis]|uniref:hypothetical protein n=1 Tax=Janibacter melonis TaxID=262209 RepID=UPI0020440BFA|nr:hypothetical protein [Janibacter melonis]MCM3556246.1 hypothetical protein [Janibacter melonis]